MKRFWIVGFFLSLSVGLGQALGLIPRAPINKPLPNTRGGTLVVQYDFALIGGPDRDHPTDVTFVVGKTMSTLGGKHQPVTFTFPYEACRRDPSMPINSFQVKDNLVLCSTDLSIDRSPPGTF